MCICTCDNAGRVLPGRLITALGKAGACGAEGRQAPAARRGRGWHLEGPEAPEAPAPASPLDVQPVLELDPVLLQPRQALYSHVLIVLAAARQSLKGDGAHARSDHFGFLVFILSSVSRENSCVSVVLFRTGWVALVRTGS